MILSYENFNIPLIKKFLNKYFFVSSMLSILIFAFFSKQIYGVVTFSPSYVYMVNEFDSLVSENILNNFIFFVLDFFKDFLIINFSQEFGLFWFSQFIYCNFLIIYK